MIPYIKIVNFIFNITIIDQNSFQRTSKTALQRDQSSCMDLVIDIKNRFILDPYNKLESQVPVGMNETNYILKQLDGIITFAQKNNVLVFLVVHPRKMKMTADEKPTSPNLYDINGSANFFSKTDLG